MSTTNTDQTIVHPSPIVRQEESRIVDDEDSDTIIVFDSDTKDPPIVEEHRKEKDKNSGHTKRTQNQITERPVQVQPYGYLEQSFISVYPLEKNVEAISRNLGRCSLTRCSDAHGHHRRCMSSYFRHLSHVP
jgi:hypothetical protein